MDGEVQPKPRLLGIPASKLYINISRGRKKFALQSIFIIFSLPTLPEPVVLADTILVQTQRHSGCITPGSLACQVYVEKRQHELVFLGYVHKNHAVHVLRV